jgi:16S rRNA (uracil1498-N3)-methyltransferase
VNLLLVQPSEIGQDGIVRLRDARSAHLRMVLKAAPGQSVRLGILDGPRGIGTVRSIAADLVELECVFDADVPPRPAVDLLLALPRPKVMRRLWAQLAALGVGQIILTNAERVERHYFDTHILRADVYGPLLVEGLQQARDTRVPAVTIHRRFKILVEDHLDTLYPHGERLLAHPGSTAIMSVLAAAAARRALLAIGPEGGWNEHELRLLEERGFQRVGIGTRTLRTDTACIALLALVHAALHDAAR